LVCKQNDKNDVIIRNELQSATVSSSLRLSEPPMVRFTKLRDFFTLCCGIFAQKWTAATHFGFCDWSNISH